MSIKKVKLSDNNIDYTKVINENFSELENTKVAKEDGKGLSTNDFTNALKAKLDKVNADAEVNAISSIKKNGVALEIDADKSVNITVPTKVSDLANDSKFVTEGAQSTALEGKVDKVEGKGLSTNDFTNTLKTKLESVETNAEVNVIETVKVNGTALEVEGKAVNVNVPTTEAINTLIESKIETGTADFITDTEVNTLLADYAKTADVTSNLNGKVDKVAGKGLSTNDYTTAEKNKLGAIEEGAQANVIESVKVNGTAVNIAADKSVDITIVDAEYSIKEATTVEGYSKTYSLTKDGEEIGAKINIPKDLVVSGGSVEVVTTAGQPYAEAKKGDKYVDLVLNDANANHIYIPVTDLVDVYTGGAGIKVSATNEISVDITTGNGLKQAADGKISMGLASTTEAGAMSSADKTKLDGVAAGAQVNKIETVKVNGTAQAITDKSININVPTAIFKQVTVGGTAVTAATAEDSFELVAGDNIQLSADAATKKITIKGVVPEQGTLVQTKSFTASDAGWGEIDADGNFTLTIANTGTPVIVKKLASAGGYETCMANLRSDGTKFYITADVKFDGQVLFF